MYAKVCLIGAAMAALLGAASAANAGGNVLVITAIYGQVEMKPVEGGPWKRAKAGEIMGAYFLRTGPRSRVHLEERGAWRPRRLNRGCVDANSLLRVGSFGCGFHVEVLKGQVSAVDGRRGKALFRTVGG